MIRSVLGLQSTTTAGELQEPPTKPSTPDGRLFDPTLVPVASVPDARRTAEALLPYLRDHDGAAVVVHVVERRPGWPDPTSPDRRMSAADRMFNVAAGAFRDGGVPVETRLLEGRDVARTILSAAADVDATSIAFVRRGGHPLVKLITGDVESALLDGSDRPVLVFAPDERE